MKGQISMEFLIILAVSIALLLMFMPIYSKVYNSIHLNVDKYVAKKNANDIITKIKILNGMENGSFFTFTVSPTTEYNLICVNKEFSLNYKEVEKPIKLSYKLPINCNGNLNIKNAQQIRLTKINNAISLTIQ